MNTLRKKIKNITLIKYFSSIKITVVCLFLLFVLTFWGTVAQVDQGLYAAQQRYFFSWYFLSLGFLPFPGARLILWVLFVNLVCVSITRFVYKKSHVGIILIHVGLLSYFISAFVTFHVTEESNLMLVEGHGSNVSSSYFNWELSAWENNEPAKRNVTAIDVNALRHDQSVPFLNARLNLQEYYANAKAFGVAMVSESTPPINASGIGFLRGVETEREPEKNFPGIIFELQYGTDRSQKVLLFGGESQPTPVSIGEKVYYFQLRRKRHVLPFTLVLDDFKMTKHPGTEIAKSYESYVTIVHDNLKRKARIYMNHPFRYKNFTLYQASYAIDQMGREISTLAVVKNSGRWLPYITALITFLGLLVHFLMMALTKKQIRT